jgi:diguanylate cyclase (GGDEF)-like protein
MKSESYSIFTGAMLRGLAKERANDRGVVDASTMFGYVAEQLRGTGQESVSFGYGRALRIVDYRAVVAKSEVDETCPYVGLNAFDESTAQWFFGRETAFKRLMLKIEQSPFVFVVGVSGSGKSSLVKAKLIPEMKRRGNRILLMKPWSNPIQKLKDVFAEILEETGTDVIEFEQCIDTDGLLAAIADLPKPILLVIDQFEEVFTVCSQVAERRKFIQMLVDVAQTQTADFVVVATMRIDFLADCTYANLDAIVNEQMVVISGMSEDELRDAIAKPAETQGYQLSDGLLDAILQDIEAEPNCLPLLEFALQELWENRNRQQRRLSLEGYRQMERLKGALNRHADRLYGQQSASGQEWMRRIFLKLVRTGKDAKDTRQRERRQVILDLARDDGNARKEIERILKSLEGKSGRLLVASEENGVAIVDLAHEVLMVGWQRFAEWRLENRDLRRLSDRVKDAFEEWIGKEKNEDYFLPNGLRLEVREQWESIKPLLSIEEQDYFHDSESYMLLREQLGGANKQLAVVVQELKNLAVLDYLTQLANRRFFDEYLEQEWQRLAAEKSPFSLIMCEIDCFKDYVDIYSHMVGDDCIRKVSRIIGESVNQPKDLAANYRGEVFALVLPNTTKEDALQKAESIKSQVVALEIPHKNSIFGKFVTLSVGVTSLVPLVTSSSLEILKSVDYELSLAKKLGKR